MRRFFPRRTVQLLSVLGMALAVPLCASANGDPASRQRLEAALSQELISQFERATHFARTMPRLEPARPAPPPEMQRIAEAVYAERGLVPERAVRPEGDAERAIRIFPRDR